MFILHFARCMNKLADDELSYLLAKYFCIEIVYGKYTTYRSLQLETVFGDMITGTLSFDGSVQ